MNLTAATRIAGVVGHPIAHSLSPVLHNAWLGAAGLDGAYVAFSLEPGRLAAFVEGFRGGSLAGVNVTLPFKTDALDAADEVSARAAAAGAANVLVFGPGGRVTADNTDGVGLLYAFARQAPGFRPDSGPLVIFGAVTGLDPRSFGEKETAAYELGLSPVQARGLQKAAYDQLRAEGLLAESPASQERRP